MRGKFSGRALIARQSRPSNQAPMHTQHSNPQHLRQKPAWQMRYEARECGKVQLFSIICKKLVQRTVYQLIAVAMAKIINGDDTSDNKNN